VNTIILVPNSCRLVLDTVDHDSSYFTQGLELSDGLMFESSGLYGQSRVRKYLPGKDNALSEYKLADKYFAEGLTLLEDELFVLTWNPSSFEIKHEIDVYSQQHSVQRINELEYAEGYIWANIWHSSLIVKINPITGELAGFYDLADLVEKHSSRGDQRVLNGIAYDANKKAFWVTGKLWPKRYLVKFGVSQ